MATEKLIAAYDLEINEIKKEQQRLADRLKELTALREKAHDELMLSKSEKLMQKDWAGDGKITTCFRFEIR